jgi:hypothetical protein
VFLGTTVVPLIPTKLITVTVFVITLWARLCPSWALGSPQNRSTLCVEFIASLGMCFVNDSRFYRFIDCWDKRLKAFVRSCLFLLTDRIVALIMISGSLFSWFSSVLARDYKDISMKITTLSFHIINGPAYVT